ncbi:MAG: hypothetical protein J0G28_02195 [Afipia sp.]|nr:hypothetical protein [Afipia sp.]OJW66128.1 MAG: hypothetical protein BGO65_03555 [Afipia sp. 64-13]
MRILVIAAALLALAMPATAQMGGGGRHRGMSKDAPAAPDKAALQKKREAEARAAKAAMDKVPEPKEKYDPWKIER